MNAVECNAAVVWQDINLRLPRSWELVRYGLNYNRGACTFSDELHERLQISWQRDTDCPDFGRLLSDLQSKERAAHAAGPNGQSNVEFLPLPAITDWHGVVIMQGGGTVTRAACYFAEQRTLVETAVFWQSERDVHAEHAILSNTRVAERSSRRKWQALGICAEVAAEMDMVSCRCLPGVTQWCFRGKKTFPSVTIDRIGFSSVWLKEPLRDWLQKRIPERSRVLRRETRETRAGHPMENVVSTRSRGHFGFLVGARVTRSDYACVCPDEQRVYHVVTETTGKDSDLLKIRCPCGDLLPYA
jgi:hypothetical protein